VTDGHHTEDSPVVEDGAGRPSRDDGEPSGSFGATAAEMANETEVEDPVEATPPAAELGAEVGALEARLAERTADLQRLQAEYEIGRAHV